ncbi:glycosyltransferase family 4 protein [Herpetosiphon llansteffanensis]
MRILHVIQRYYPYIGGSEQVCQVIAERLAAEGHTVDVWTSNAWDLDHFWAKGRRTIDQPNEQHNGVAIRRFSVVRAPGPALVYPILRRAMLEMGRLPATSGLLMELSQITPRLPAFNRALRQQIDQFDLVHAANITLDFMLIPALKYAKQAKVPFVLSPYVHLGVPGDRSLVRYYTMPHHIKLMQQADRVIVQTPLEADYLADCGIPRATMRCIGVGVEPSELAGGDADRFRQETGIHQPFVLYIGTLAKEKGAFDLIRAMEQLWANGRDEHLVMVGTPMAHFEQLWETLDPASKQRIHVFARAPQERKRDALAAASLFAMPSRTDSFGIVYLEAWLYRLPVIGARAGGVPAVIRDGETGLLVDYGNVDQLTSSLTKLLIEPALAQQLGQRGYEQTLAELTWQHKYAQIRAVYEELMRT